MTTITIDRAMLEQAVEELLPVSYNSTDDPRGQADKAIALLRAALAAQQSQDRAQRGDPVVYIRKDQLEKAKLAPHLCEVQPAPQPERKPMTDDETLALFDRVKVRMLFTDAEVAPFASGVAAAEHFHGIRDKT